MNAALTVIALVLVPYAMWQMVNPPAPRWMRELEHREAALITMARWTDGGRTGDHRANDRWRLSVGPLEFLDPKYSFAKCATGTVIEVTVPNAMRADNVGGRVKARMYVLARKEGMTAQVKTHRRPYGVVVVGTLLRS